jgi:curli production assembly/transport component CsgE
MNNSIQYIRKFLICFFILFAHSVNAQMVSDKDSVRYTYKTTNDGVEFMDFVFDKTITKIGSDFFRMFHSQWENPTNIRGLSIIIGEKPMPGMGTQIWVMVNDRYSFIAFVRPNLEQLRQSVDKALEQTQAYFINYQLIKSDLDSDDFSGSGIF